jgi:chromosome segregation protein
MRLKRLELFGFKSFADRTVFEFGSNTLTGVVGPNGCGKSNVVDSVRWVLGEQRPTSMRGAEMTDVIFKGSASRPPLAVAEVTLILDNASGTLEGRGAEVSITRRVFKSGEGEYLIDGDKLRLKDVREMLFDTGLGSRGYSVLEQGKIDAVLSVNPLERRRIFEEAAGISRYRQRKVESELRLKRVADDMARLDDVIGELSTRVRSLKIQAGKAERFAEAREQWSRERARYLKHRVWTISGEVRVLTDDLRALEESAQSLKGRRSRSETEVAAREREGQALAAEVERLLEESTRLAGDGRALDERRAHAASRVVGARSSHAEETERARALAAALAEKRAESEKLARAVEALTTESRAAGEQATKEAQAVRELEREWRDQRAACERQNEAVLALLYQRTELENRVRTLGESCAPAAQRGERMEERVAEARENVAALERAEAQALARVEESHGAQAKHELARRELAQRMAELAAQTLDAEKEKNRLELDRARAQSRIEFLLDRERDLEELSQGARRVLEGIQASGEPCDASQLLGLVADHLRTDTRHARALDAVLGLRGSALVLRDRETALKVAAWLTSRDAGQVGLALPSGIARRARAAEVELGAQDAALVLGRLREHVRCASEFVALADLVCGDVLVVRDLAGALALVERHPELRCVTLEGELVDAAGVLSGARSLAQGAVGRRSSAADLGGDVEELARRIRAVEEDRVAIQAARTALQKNWERSSQELEARRQARAEAESALSTSRSRLRDLEASLRALEHESGALGAESREIERELEKRRGELCDASAAFERANAELARLEARRRELEEERERRLRSAGSAEVESTRARTELEGASRRRADLERACAEAGAELERARRLIEEHAETTRAGAAECERLAQESTAVLAERGSIEERLRAQREAAAGGRDAIEAVRRRVESVTNELEEVGARASDRRLSVQRLELERGELVRRAQEELSLAEHALLQDFEPDPALSDAAALEALDAEVRECKARLDKLGPVNMEAVAELAEVGGRLEFLQAQHRDLKESRDALLETVRTIDDESKRLFLETFEAVRANFQRIFRQLFGGGRADVHLEEGVDVLDSGVEIVARPPGRELLSIGLLSGGQRTLTALALLFAVFETRPSPFCILDEVDAALDDANVDRFLSMLDGFRRSTQFVVVTHNKGTMAACETLYGVTMETKGVSRQVAVQLDDADRWVERADPEPASPPSVDAAATEIDVESGERVVELIPAAVDPSEAGHNGSHPARAERRARSKAARPRSAPPAREDPRRAADDSASAPTFGDGQVRASEG